MQCQQIICPKVCRLTNPPEDRKRLASRAIPNAPFPTKVGAAAEAVGSTIRLPRQHSRSAASAIVTEPGDLVARALAILAEQNDGRNNQVRSVDLPSRQESRGNVISSIDLPLQRRLISDGTAVQLPIRYFDAQCLLATFTTNLERAAELLRGTGVRAVPQEDGKAIVLLGCFEYRDTDIGAYNEFCIGVSALAPGDPIPALYVTNLPVTTATANSAGQEIWGFNKFVTPIAVRRDGKKFSTTVHDPENALILMLEGKRGASVPAPPADVLTFSVLAGRLIKTVIRVMTPWQLGSGGDFALHVGKSGHPMAHNLRTLALDGAHPVLVQYGDPLQFLLFPGGAL
jgi:Acetoacetate decarboxylase (ADC)